MFYPLPVRQKTDPGQYCCTCNRAFAFKSPSSHLYELDHGIISIPSYLRKRPLPKARLFTRALKSHSHGPQTMSQRCPARCSHCCPQKPFSFGAEQWGIEHAAGPRDVSVAAGALLQQRRLSAGYLLPAASVRGLCVSAGALPAIAASGPTSKVTSRSTHHPSWFLWEEG